jgi:hypothetical protein
MVNADVYGVGNTTYTVPTAPLTAITNTYLLLNFTNAGIIDNTGKNVLETVGNAQIDTTVKKYGTGSVEFDASGDGLSIPASPDLQFLTRPFTVEAWVYIKAGTTTGVIIYDNRSPDTANLGFNFYLEQSGGLYRLVLGTALSNWILGSYNLAREQWHHVAVTRDGNTFRIFTNGSLAGTFNGSSTQNFTNSVARIGYGVNGSQANSYFDDVRVTKGVARYTANFTPPTAAFLDQ